MKRPCSNRFKLHTRPDNAGMSLVEVIIAITIMGVVMVPVCQALTTAMIYNSKARTRQELTLSAESVMETFKGYDIAQLEELFAAGSGLPGLTCEGESACTEDANGTLTFTMNGFRSENDKLYNITVTAVPSTTENVFEISDMDATRDAVFSAEREWDTDALENAQNDLANHQGDLAAYFAGLKDEDGETVEAMYMKADGTGAVIADDVESIFSQDAIGGSISDYVELYERHLILEITAEGTVKASMEYTYYVTGYPYYIPDEQETVTDAYTAGDEDSQDSADAEDTKVPGAMCYVEHFPMKDTGDKDYLTYTVELGASATVYDGGRPQRLFVFYYPQYELDTGRDIIKILNTEGITDFECYVIKQTAADMTEAKLKVAENGYRATVEVTNSAAGFALYHNFDDNIGGGSSVVQPSITGSSITSGSYTDTGEDSPFLYEEELAYQVTVEITDASTGQTVAQLESTMNEKIKHETGEEDETQTSSE